ncbi:energy transducer TonB [Hymenobacter norwichensis]|uniref:energy transducer TonB n=1 Tax=Hymenobacter telluris TaxID=2816474 RepID=UPI001A8FD8C6|nr:energy transducer TonB [Hymenobacter telluris]MBW3375998.1 energy transducer TonB [Hymenobacter norwichensis]
MLLLFLLLPPGLLAQTLAASRSATTAVASPETPPKPPAAPEVYLVAEEMPTFPGGAVAFQRFLKAKIKYPEQAIRLNLSGKVHVSFVVDEEGRILDPKVVKGLGGGLDEEALRLVRIMPWWTPGRVNGQPVRVAYTLPVGFRMLE